VKPVFFLYGAFAAAVALVVLMVFAIGWELTK